MVKGKIKTSVKLEVTGNIISRQVLYAIDEAVRAYSYNYKELYIEQKDIDRYDVTLDGKVFGIYDMQKRTFID